MYLCPNSLFYNLFFIRIGQLLIKLIMEINANALYRLDYLVWVPGSSCPRNLGVFGVWVFLLFGWFGWFSELERFGGVGGQQNSSLQADFNLSFHTPCIPGRGAADPKSMKNPKKNRGRKNDVQKLRICCLLEQSPKIMLLFLYLLNARKPQEMATSSPRTCPRVATGSMANYLNN